MRQGSLPLADYPADLVRLACARCDRRGQYRKARLIADHGAEIALPDLRHRLAACPRHGALGDACGVHFPDLVRSL